MSVTPVSRLKRAWNAFLSREPTYDRTNYGYGYSYRPDRFRSVQRTDRTIVASVRNRIALDVASVSILHAVLDENGRFVSERNSHLNECLTLSANLDQTGRSFIQDVVLSMLDEGVVAILPVETDQDPETGAFDIYSMRVGQILEWYPNAVKIRAYNEISGRKEDIVMDKNAVAIVENPFYSVMNEPNSTIQRLVNKLSLLDVVDEQNCSGKLDMIIQLPYVIKTETRRKQAEERRQAIEDQLSGSRYGIAYTDGAERITQLNRPVENNLLKQIEYLTSLMFSQLGITQSILDGTADEKTMLNYYTRIIEPILSAIVDEMRRKFLTKTARTQRQSIVFYRDPFKLVPVNDMADIADKFTRNEILSSNEIRQIVGFKPSDDPRADELRNKNISEPADRGSGNTPETKEITTDLKEEKQDA